MLLYALFNVVCVVVAPLAGRLGDRVGRTRVVMLGYALYGGINLALVFIDSRAALVALFAAYGLFYAIEDSQTKAYITDLEPERRATAIGAYNFVSGTLYLPASLVAGGLWALAPGLAFALAAGLSLAAIVALGVLRPAAAPAVSTEPN